VRGYSYVWASGWNCCVKEMNFLKKIEKILLLIIILLILCVGFSITINNFHCEFKGLINILINIIN
jgi:hypothetical protein